MRSVRLTRMCCRVCRLSGFPRKPSSPHCSTLESDEPILRCTGETREQRIGLNDKRHVAATCFELDSRVIHTNGGIGYECKPERASHVMRERGIDGQRQGGLLSGNRRRRGPACFPYAYYSRDSGRRVSRPQPYASRRELRCSPPQLSG